MINPYDVAFLADGNSKIGMGHIIRTSAIADALIESGLRVCFIVSDESAAPLLRQKGYPAISLQSDYLRLFEQGERIISLLKKHQVRFLFSDSYFASVELFAQLRNICKVGCFGYGTRYSGSVDLIVPYGASADSAWYSKTFSQNETTVLLGSRYVPLGKQYWSSQKSLNGDNNSILVTSGSTDPFNICDKLVSKIRSSEILADYTVHLIVGGFFDDNALHKHYDGDDHVVLHEGLTDLSPVIRASKMAVCAGGVTLYEIMACGVPAVAYAFADNQLGNRALGETVVWCGDIRNPGSPQDVSVESILIALEKLACDRDLRERIAKSECELCDGKGALRIAEAIRKMF